MTAAERKSPQIVEMNWDPITRIIGNLGVYTKIDFANRVVTECHSTSSLFRGYSVFMKGKDPRDAGFITSRICGICGDNHTTCSVYAQNMAYGIKPPPQAENIINLGEAAEYMFDHTLFQDNLVFVDFCEAMVKQTNPGVLARAENTEAPHAGRARLPHDRGHHAVVQPLRGRLLPAGVEGVPDHPGDVLPDGGPPRAPVHGLPRRGGHLARADAVHRLHLAADQHPGLHQALGRDERRHVRLLLRGTARVRGGRQATHPARLLGRVPELGRLRLPLRDDERLGQGDVRHARASWSTASW